MITHDKCSAFEARIQELEEKVNIAVKALSTLANDYSPPWDSLDWRKTAKEALYAMEPERADSPF